jgi:hypothetical protein
MIKLHKYRKKLYINEIYGAEEHILSLSEAADIMCLSITETWLEFRYEAGVIILGMERRRPLRGRQALGIPSNVFGRVFRRNLKLS